MKIIHSVDHNGELERLISLDGSGREVIRAGDTVTCIFPDQKSVVVEKSKPHTEFPPKFPVTITHLSEFYNFKVAQDDRVANRKVIKLVIKPRDNYRYGHNLWVDSETGLLLKDHLVGEKGNSVEQFMFTQVNYPGEISKDNFKQSENSKKYTWHNAKKMPAGTDSSESMDWKVVQTPPGFMPGMKRQQNITTSAMPVEHFMFSDGLASISVFVEKKMKNSKNLIGSSKMGAVNAYGRLVGDYYVTVVGEVPHATVKMIGDSVIQVNKK
jgi:sigma-E factor negative regulatory protein RseB